MADAPPASQPAAVIEGPITYYNNNCNRCHGQVDAAYPDSTKPPKGEALKKVIIEMAEGPGQAPLDPPALAEQVKLHEAIFDGGPYVWVDPMAKNVIRGETIPGSNLSITFQSAIIEPVIKDGTFVFHGIPAEVRQVRMDVTRNQKIITLDLDIKR